MKNTVGQVHRGDNFFPREDLINKIYNKLDAEAHLYLAAPRRMGKTAIMRRLEDQPRNGYEFHYLITESINHPVVYLEELVKTLQRFNTWNDRTFQFIKEWLPKLRLSFSESESEAGLVLEQHRDPFEKFKAFIKELDTNGHKIVVMIDEFPQTVENISRKHGADTATQFLQFNREIRQLANPNLRFILTGSIGLYAVAEKLEATQTLNDLNTLEIPPLSKSQATALVTQLLDEVHVAYQPEICKQLPDRIGFHPFYLQLAAQELIDEFESTGRTIEASAIERAFNNILRRRNDNYFEHYHQRLKTVLSDKDFPLALAILSTLAIQEHGLNSSQIQELATPHTEANLGFILRSLEFDGYLFENQNADTKIYHFTSPILREWWKRRVVGV
ncbi:MAG: hypothetical protein BWK79_09415 [Beggiatoa sp. IS2]|nr:MAG: hypothetical protein BWK79_09415 [Beggiatoa sp. IS2]